MDRRRPGKEPAPQTPWGDEASELALGEACADDRRAVLTPIGRVAGILRLRSRPGVTRDLVDAQGGAASGATASANRA